MLWKFSCPFSGYIDAPPTVVEARKALIAKIQANPESFISKLEPCEPSCSTVLELGKKVLGLK